MLVLRYWLRRRFIGLRLQAIRFIINECYMLWVAKLQ
jgi:hypothetical protein